MNNAVLHDFFLLNDEFLEAVVVLRPSRVEGIQDSDVSGEFDGGTGSLIDGFNSTDRVIAFDFFVDEVPQKVFVTDVREPFFQPNVYVLIKIDYFFLLLLRRYLPFQSFWNILVFVFEHLPLADHLLAELVHFARVFNHFHHQLHL